ncbi:serine--tRNA ligase [candidate division WOR-3 bacterium]|nr:serine--tRNA ligase [candidate division WOR-3 bacterium]
MFDIKFIRENIELINRGIKEKGESVDINKFIKLDEKRRKLIGEIDDIRREKKKLSQDVAQLKRDDKDASRLIGDSKSLSEKEKKLDNELQDINSGIQEIMAGIPNLAHPDIPRDKETVAQEYGEPKEFDFKPLAAEKLCDSLGILDFARGSKIAGTNFPCYLGLGARLERAFINFMIDLHTKQGYTEVFPPFLANRKSMFGTAQLPKLEDDMYFIPREELFLNPTAEVPLVNLHQDETLKAEKLPIKYVGYAASFRREAGSYGKETRGLRRVHQFNKVELIKFTSPKNSYEELESMLKDAEEVLKLLGLRYRVLLLPVKDLSFASAKTYDIEVWASASQEWLEVSSVSNCESFQARRAGIRFKEKGKSSKEFVHILNGSGVATPRTFIALIEQYQEKDGSIKLPDVLIPYMGGIDKIK